MAYLALAEDEAAVLYVIGEVGDQVVISYSAPTDRWGAFEGAAEQLLRSLKFVED